MTATPHLLIVGGGMTGLAAAYMAATAGRRVTVLEGHSAPGGLLATFPVGGNRLEHFYHHFFTHDAELHWLLRELGLESRIRYLPASMGIYRRGHIYPFDVPADILKFDPISLVSRVRFAATSLYLAAFADWNQWENVSCLEWFEHYAGKEATDAIWRPMLEIKFGPYARRVPVAWMVGRLRQRMSSRRRGGESLGYIDGSLSVLLDGLLSRLQSLGVQVLTHHPVESLEASGRRVVAVRTPHGIFEADEILATIPADRFADLLHGVDRDYADSLRRIEHFGAVCTILEMDRPLGTAYWLNVADPGFPFGGVIEHTRLLSPENYSGRHIVYLSRYFERGNSLATMPVDEVVATMTTSLVRLYPKLLPEHILGSHVFRTNTAAFACDLGFSRNVPAMRSPIEGLGYAGMVHVYPDERSCNNCIRVAADALWEMGCDTSRVPKGRSLSGEISKVKAKHKNTVD